MCMYTYQTQKWFNKYLLGLAGDIEHSRYRVQICKVALSDIEEIELQDCGIELQSGSYYVTEGVLFYDTKHKLQKDRVLVVYTIIWVCVLDEHTGYINGVSCEINFLFDLLQYGWYASKSDKAIILTSDLSF